MNAIRHGTVAMPDFQRDFVWNPKNVISLLASVSNRWPIGSILISDRDDHSAIESLRLKNFEGSPAPEPDQVTAIVLDGQQRLTSLLHALVPESSKTMYYVEDVMAIFLRRKLNPDTPFSLTEADFTSLSQSDFNKKYPTIQDRATQGVATVEDISNSSKFFRWISHLNPDQWNGEQWELDELRKDIFGDLEQYNITSLKLSSDLGLEPLAVIFETVNKTGVRLDIDDLMLAKLYPSGFHLHDKWDEAVAEFAQLGEFGDQWGRRSVRGSGPITSLGVLKLIAYLNNQGIKRGDVLGLEATVVKTHWNDAVRAVNDGIEFLKTQCGVVCSSLLPDDTIVLPVAAYLLEGNSDFGLLKRWYWRAIVDETYLRNTSTQPVSDATTLIRGDLPEGFSVVEHGYDDVFVSLTNKLLEQRRSHDVLMKGVCGLLVTEGAEDWLKNTQLTHTSADIELHHIFPMRYSINQGWRKGSQDNPVNITANLTPLLASSNKSIGSSPPAVVTAEHRDARRAIATHSIDENVYDISSLDAFREFSGIRARNLARKLLDRC